MKSLPKLLSKTKIMQGYQCLKSIYLSVHNKEIKIEITPDQQAIFDQGHFVTEYARKKFPDGVLVDNVAWDFFGSLKKTRELLKEETEIIFEAAFEYQGCYARADIIKYSQETKRWSIYEVKSSTKLKEEYIHDVGLQTWIMKNSGLEIERIYILHINPECTYPHLDFLFKEVDVTEVLNEKYDSISTQLNHIFSSLKQDNEPDIQIGSHCFSPYECSYKKHCFQQQNIPEVSVLNIPKIAEKKWELINQGIIELSDSRMPQLEELQQRMVQSHLTNQIFFDKEKVQNEIQSWSYPHIYLDFETIAPVIPRYRGTRPYQQVPFQFSVHIQNEPEGSLQHFEYLHTDETDPRPMLIQKLLKACAVDGTIIAYYAPFEIARIQELADYSIQHATELLKLIDRFKDPLPLIREAIYNPDFKGSFSLKSVAPALLGDEYSYDHFLVGNGTAAQRAFEEMISDKTSTDRRYQLIHGLLEYCKQDTFVMVKLVEYLKKQSEV